MNVSPEMAHEFMKVHFVKFFVARLTKYRFSYDLVYNILLHPLRLMLNWGTYLGKGLWIRSSLKIPIASLMVAIVSFLKWMAMV